MSVSISQTRSATQDASMKAAWWRRPWSASRKTNCVGINIGINAVDVSIIGTDRSGGSPSLQWLSQSGFPLPIDPALAPQPNWVETVTESLRESLPRCVDGENSVAVVALPASWIHYQTTSEAEFAANKQQCDAMFAGSIFACPAHLSRWPLLPGSSVDTNSEAAEKKVVMMAATAEAAACQVAEVIMDLGYQVQSILPHGIALLGAARSLTSLTPSAMLLLEQSGGLIAIANEAGCGLCRHLPTHTTSASQPSRLAEIEPWLREVAEELLASSCYVTRLGGIADDQSPVMICGSVAAIEGVDSALATMINRPVATWRYADRQRPIRQGKNAVTLRGDAVHAVSLSLACCGTVSSNASWRDKT